MQLETARNDEKKRGTWEVLQFRTQPYDMLPILQWSMTDCQLAGAGCCTHHRQKSQQDKSLTDPNKPFATMV
jgi:hypothetical protein